MTKLNQIMHFNRPSFVPVTKSDINNYMLNFQDEINRTISHFFNGVDVFMTDWDEKIPNALAVDLIESETRYEVKAPLRGFNLKDIDVEVANGFLTIRGQSGEKKEKKDAEGNYIRRECSCGYTQRTIALPETADCNKAEASFKNGVLSVSIPKNQAALVKPRKITVKAA